MIINKPKGTNDILENIEIWHYLENIIYKFMNVYGFQEIRTPIFEHTELFLRVIGNSSDIVNKEMYTFFDKANRSITLRPESTASIARSFIEKKIYSKILPAKYYYIEPMFRYSKPQAGRYRQFNQFGIEVLGSNEPFLDGDIILLSMNLLESFGLKKIKLLINSIGCENCRINYKKFLIKYLNENYSSLCKNCKNKIIKNPLMIFDCKNNICKNIMKEAPKITDYLCKECQQHFEKVQEYLNFFNIKYTLDKSLVRGLDYYTNTIFEVVFSESDSQNSILGGGRYNNLIKLLGGPNIPGIGFSIGLERAILLLLKNQSSFSLLKNEKKIFIAIADHCFYKYASNIMNILRKNNIKTTIDIMKRSLKAQFKYANKIGITHVITIGESELKKEKYPLKNMLTGEEKFLSLKKIINILKEV